MSATVQNMVCPQCGRLHGARHVQGCPESGEYPPMYRLGWTLAMEGLVPPLCVEIMQLRARLAEATHA